MKNDVLKNFAQKAKRRLVGRENVPTAKIKVISNEDDEFRTRVESLLSREDVVTNPVHYLIDDKIFNNLSENEKERYLLTTLDRYSKLKSQIENSTTSYTRFCM